MIDKNLIKRFWENTKLPANSTDCWLWTGSQTVYGYGQISAGGRKNRKIFRAHRLSYEIHNGEIRSGLCVLHKCDNTICVNPAHLFLGTQAENVYDCVKKGRANGGSLKGEKNPNAKLNLCQINDIRKKYKSGAYYQRELGVIYGVSQAQIGLIIGGKSWA